MPSDHAWRITATASSSAIGRYRPPIDAPPNPRRVIRNPDRPSATRSKGSYGMDSSRLCGGRHPLKVDGVRSAGVSFNQSAMCQYTEQERNGLRLVSVRAGGDSVLGVQA